MLLYLCLLLLKNNAVEVAEGGKSIRAYRELKSDLRSVLPTLCKGQILAQYSSKDMATYPARRI